MFGEAVFPACSPLYLVRLSRLAMTSSRGYFVTHEAGLPPKSPVREIACQLVRSAAA